MKKDESANSFRWQGLRIRNSAVYIAAFALSAVLLLLILVSPLLLRALARAHGINWSQLSDIGQTYGAASAILSGIALVGVSLSLIVQARQAKAERIRVVRERHMELLSIALEDPEVYARAMGTDVDAFGENSRAFIFTTMFVNYGRMGYQMGVITESSIRADFFQGLFQSELGRAWWNKYRPLWVNNPVPERRARQFVKIMDDEYHKAIIAGTPMIAFPSNKQSGDAARTTRYAGHLCASAAIGFGVGIGIILRSRAVNRGRVC